MVEYAEYSFKLSLPSQGNDISDESWEEQIAEQIRTWRDARTTLSQLHIGEGSQRASIEFDWQPVIQSCRKYARAMRAFDAYLHQGPPNGKPPYHLFQKRNTRVPIVVRLERCSGEKYPSIHTQMCVEQAMSQLFLIMNIANPGCFDLYQSELISSDETHSSSRRRSGRQRINLSKFHYEMFKLRLEPKSWPKPKVLDLESTANWFLGTQPRDKSHESKRLNQVFSSLLYLASDELNPMDVVWIFYCLETLLGTTPGENRTALVRRISLLLGANPKQQKFISRSMKPLYNYRSSIVHGNQNVIHHLENVTSGEAFDSEYDKLFDRIEIGYAILIACLQVMAERQWHSVCFGETIQGLTAEQCNATSQ